MMTHEVEKKPWVIIMGDTGATLTEEQKSLGVLLEKLQLEEEKLKNISMNYDRVAAEHFEAENVEVDEWGFAIRSDEFKKIIDAKSESDAIVEKLKMNISQIITSLENSTYHYYLPPKELLRKCHIEMVEGSQLEGSEKASKLLEEKKYGAAFIEGVKGISTKDIYHFIKDTGEAERVAACIEKLKNAETLPSRIVLNGHSRGAASCLELSRAIYEAFGDKIKVDIIINDPVPGPGGHVDSKKVIMPNVESLIITYAARENQKYLTPINVNSITFDKSKTLFTAITLDAKHKAMSDDVPLINQAFLRSMINGDKIEKLDLKTLTTQISSNRKDKIDIKAHRIAGVNETLNDFHQSIVKSEIYYKPGEELALKQSANITNKNQDMGKDKKSKFTTIRHSEKLQRKSISEGVPIISEKKETKKRNKSFSLTENKLPFAQDASKREEKTLDNSDMGERKYKK